MCWCCLIKDAVHGNKWVLLTLPFFPPLDVQWEPVAEIRRVRTADAGGACVLAEAPANRRMPVEGGHVLTPLSHGMPGHAGPRGARAPPVFPGRQR